MPQLSLLASTVMFAAMVLTSGEAAADTCGHAWAVPGTYTITGNFRGTIERTGARLTRNCRVRIQMPGVYSGSKVTRTGRCLRFRFKVEGIKKTFSARWCNKVGFIPWNGRQVRARVSLVKKFRVSGG